MELPDRSKEELAEDARIEEWALTALGYGHCLDTEVMVASGAAVRGRNFLDAYGDSPHRQDTEDLLRGFQDMSPDDPDYAAAKAYILRFVEAQFGPPPAGGSQ